MGTTLSIKTGLGFAVPPEIVTAYEEEHWDDEEYEGFYDYLDGLIDFKGPLDYAVADYYGYNPTEDGKPGYAVFLKSTVTAEYGAGVFSAPGPLGADYVPEEYEAINELADKLGIVGLKLEWLTVVSIG